ncbi:hypothetical protein AB4Y32_26240 [Paraburkholderia phymatum]|uniref:Uncharacterized protein n=1 Tax=Paraburkholderia phymatum TaxID=148447 RepID=A0ACC6U6R1_9BURK
MTFDFSPHSPTRSKINERPEISEIAAKQANSGRCAPPHWARLWLATTTDDAEALCRRFSESSHMTERSQLTWRSGVGSLERTREAKHTLARDPIGSTHAERPLLEGRHTTHATHNRESKPQN